MKEGRKQGRGKEREKNDKLQGEIHCVVRLRAKAQGLPSMKVRGFHKEVRLHVKAKALFWLICLSF